jgi:hypothetical protein
LLLLLYACEPISQEVQAGLKDIVTECLRFGQQHLYGKQAGKRDDL